MIRRREAMAASIGVLAFGAASTARACSLIAVRPGERKRRHDEFVRSAKSSVKSFIRSLIDEDAVGVAGAMNGGWLQLNGEPIDWTVDRQSLSELNKLLFADAVPTKLVEVVVLGERVFAMVEARGPVDDCWGFRVDYLSFLVSDSPAKILGVDRISR